MLKISTKNHLLYLLIVVAVWSLPGSGQTQNFPPLSIEIADSAATEGYYFLTPYTNTPPYVYDHVQLILDNYGRVVFYRVYSKGINPNSTIDFKLQPNGYMS